MINKKKIHVQLHKTKVVGILGQYDNPNLTKEEFEAKFEWEKDNSIYLIEEVLVDYEIEVCTLLGMIYQNGELIVDWDIIRLSAKSELEKILIRNLEDTFYYESNQYSVSLSNLNELFHKIQVCNMLKNYVFCWYDLYNKSGLMSLLEAMRIFRSEEYAKYIIVKNKIEASKDVEEIKNLLKEYGN